MKLVENEKFEYDFSSFLEKEFLKNESLIKKENKISLVNYLISYSRSKNDFEKSKKYGQKVSKLKGDNYSQNKNLAEIYNKLIFPYFYTSQVDSSQFYLNKSKLIYSEINDKAGILRSDIISIRFKMYNRNYHELINLIDNVIVEAENSKDANVILDALLQKIEIYQSMENNQYFKLNEDVYLRFLNNKTILKSKQFMFKLYYIQSLLLKKKLDKAKVLLDNIKEEIINSNLNSAIELYGYLLELYNIETNAKSLDNEFYNQLLLKYKKEKDFLACYNIYQLLIYDAKKRNNFKKANELSSQSFLTYNQYISEKSRIKTIEYEIKFEKEKLKSKIRIDEIALEKKNQAILLLITFIFIIGLFLVIYYLISEQKRRRKEVENKTFTNNQLFHNIEIERKRIANDLHDSISSNLLELKTKHFNGNLEASAKIVQIIDNLRKISRDLHPLMFERLRLKAAIEDIVNNLQNHQDFFISSDIQYNNSLDVNVELQIFRIVQEALNNIVKHSKAKAVMVLLMENDVNIILEIRDNGIGFNFKQKFDSKKSFGIHSMVQRANSFGAKVIIESNESGTVVKLKMKK